MRWGQAKGTWFTNGLEVPFLLRFWTGNGKGKNVFVYDSGYTKLYQVKVWNEENSWFLTNDTLQEVPRPTAPTPSVCPLRRGLLRLCTSY